MALSYSLTVTSSDHVFTRVCVSVFAPSLLAFVLIHYFKLRTVVQ